jgi:hypothetical protein
MSLDWKDGASFDQWREQFVNALGSSASSPGNPKFIVEQADEVAQLAVILIQQRAKEAGR